MAKSKIRNPNSKIGIDASRAMRAQKTGTEHYSASLLGALAVLPEAARWPVALYVNGDNPQAAIRNLQFDLPQAWSIRAIPFPRLWTHIRLSAEMALHAPRALFVPSHVVPLWHPRRTAVTVHDLGYLQYPQAHTRLSRLYLHLSTWFSAHAARRVVAISQATKQDLIRHYRIKPEKIVVVYHGRDPIFRPVASREIVEATAAKYGVRQPYCLHVGTLQPRKNIGLLIEAWGMLRERMEQPPQLLLAGKRGWLYSSLFEAVESAGFGDLIKFADYVERDDLPALYSGAMSLTFPSLYEGFGLPALEAMSCGTPVIGSNATSIPEVVGDAGLLLDPKDANQWAETIEKLAGDEEEQRRLSERGLAQAARFTWERCARETWGILTTM